jgi:hypothetical protein
MREMLVDTDCVAPVVAAQRGRQRRRRRRQRSKTSFLKMRADNPSQGLGITKA